MIHPGVADLDDADRTDHDVGAHRVEDLARVRHDPRPLRSPHGRPVSHICWQGLSKDASDWSKLSLQLTP